MTVNRDVRSHPSSRNPRAQGSKPHAQRRDSFVLRGIWVAIGLSLGMPEGETKFLEKGETTLPEGETTFLGKAQEILKNGKAAKSVLGVLPGGGGEVTLKEYLDLKRQLNALQVREGTMKRRLKDAQKRSAKSQDVLSQSVSPTDLKKFEKLKNDVGHLRRNLAAQKKNPKNKQAVRNIERALKAKKEDMKSLEKVKKLSAQQGRAPEKGAKADATISKLEEKLQKNLAQQEELKEKIANHPGKELHEQVQKNGSLPSQSTGILAQGLPSPIPAAPIPAAAA